jgi:hypothetical protein
MPFRSLLSSARWYEYNLLSGRPVLVCGSEDEICCELVDVWGGSGTRRISKDDISSNR